MGGSSAALPAKRPNTTYHGFTMVDVSVLTPSLGYGRFLEDAIRSVLGQEGLSVQHVIQDGGSQDETLEVLHRYARAIDWKSEPDEGQSDALNRAFQRAEGRWVAWVNADEFYLPGSLATLVEAGDRTSADLVYGDSVFVDERRRFLRLSPQHRFSPLVLRLHGCYISSSCTVIRRSALSPRPWDPDIRMIMDWDLYLQLAGRKASFLHVKYPAGAFRRHSAQVTARPSEDSRDEYERLFERHAIRRSMRRWGKWLHRLHKAAAGGYRRQFCARRFRGRDVGWFDSDVGMDWFNSLMSSCYART